MEPIKIIIRQKDMSDELRKSAEALGGPLSWGWGVELNFPIKIYKAWRNKQRKEKE